MRFAIPHKLEKDEVRRRFQSRSHEIADQIPGGMAKVSTSWPSEDRMQLDVSALGQSLAGHIDIAESEVVFEFDLPPALSFVEPMIRKAVEAKGQKLLS
jgi:Putative polyhydroxyalkanoic acid system protein (PHA_gran_rgn)